eukprot:EG_transcript_5569
MKRCQVIIPLVTSRWCRCEENLLVLYYALRQALLQGSPTIFPVLFPEVTKAIDTPDFWVAKLLRDNFFSIPFAQPLQGVVDKICAFLKGLDLGVQDVTVGRGAAFSDVYADSAAKVGLKHTNAGLVSLLSRLETLTEVDLSQNYIGTLGLQALCPVIGMKPDLTRLNLQGNGITNAGVSTLVNVLVAHPGITSLNLSQNDISNVAAAELNWLVNCNEHITELNLEETCIRLVWRKRIQAKLEENRRRPMAADHEDGLRRAAAYRDDVPVEEGPVPPDVNKWSIVMTVTPKGGKGGLEDLQADVSVTLTDPTKLTLHHTFRYADPENAGGAIFEGLRDYLKGFEANTIAVSRRVGTTVKLVLEDVGTGMERLQRLCREEFTQEHPMTDQSLLYVGYHVVDVRLIFQAQPDTEEGSFFIEGMVAYNGEERVAKKLMKLYRDNIFKCKGNLAEELQWLIPRVAENDLLDEDDLQQLEALEERELQQEHAKEEALARNVVTYWKCAPATFHQKVTAPLREVLQRASRSVAGVALAEELPPDLLPLQRAYQEACLARTAHPPYNY